MTLDELYNKRIERLMPYINSKARGNKDLEQELCIGIYLALKSHPDCTDSYLKRRANWSMMNHFRNKTQPLRNWVFQDYNISNDDSASNSAPVSSTDSALEKITYTEFLLSLTNIERLYVYHRFLGWPSGKIKEKYNLSEYSVTKLKRNIRHKISRYYP